MLIKYPLTPQPIVGTGKILLCVKITVHFYSRFFFNSVFVGGCFPPQMYVEIAVCLLWLHEYSRPVAYLHRKTVISARILMFYSIDKK